MSKNAQRFQQPGKGTKQLEQFAKKSFGQNFLEDSLVLQKIIEAAEILPNAAVLEVGPGLGALTRELLAANAKITAVELDPRAVSYLQKTFHGGQFSVIPGSILDVDLDAIMGEKPYQVVANIPYHITNPIIKKLLTEGKNLPTSCVLMVQKEVAEKIVNPKKNSLLQLSVDLFATAELVCIVPRNAFVPAPKVDSAVLKIVRRGAPLASNKVIEATFQIAKKAFQQKRKQLGNTLRPVLGESLEVILGETSTNARPETISSAEWTQIGARFLTWQQAKTE